MPVPRIRGCPTMPEKQPLIMMQPTEFFWTNNNGHRLHIRRVEHPKPKALLVYCHGYGCHMNAPRVWDKLCHYSEQLEVDIITFDMQGHGYSEGARALVPSFDDLAADVADFVNLLHAAATPTCESYNLCSSTSLKQMQHLPFTLCGESMGAAVAILASLHLPRLHSSNRFLGLILAAPGIQDPATGKGPTFLARGFSSVLRQAPCQESKAHQACRWKFDSQNITEASRPRLWAASVSPRASPQRSTVPPSSARRSA